MIGKFSPIIFTFLSTMIFPSEYSPDLMIIESKLFAILIASMIVLIDPFGETIIVLVTVGFKQDVMKINTIKR
jgi:hypothetical protein